MIKAFLRRKDLIPPDYPNGLASRIRERLILDAISCEDHEQRMERTVSLDQVLVGLVAPNARQELLNKILDLNTSRSYLSDINLHMAAQVAKTNKRTEVKEVYDILDKHGHWDKFSSFTPSQWDAIINDINKRMEEDRKKEADATDS